jgi:hypothetical protein
MKKLRNPFCLFITVALALADCSLSDGDVLILLLLTDDPLDGSVTMAAEDKISEYSPGVTIEKFIDAPRCWKIIWAAEHSALYHRKFL